MRYLASFLLPVTLVVMAVMSSSCVRQAEEEEGLTFHFERADVTASDGTGFAPIRKPGFPTLPAQINEATSDDQIANMAVHVSLAEAADGSLPEGVDVPQRQRDILAFWMPQARYLREFITENNHRRQSEHEHALAEAEHRRRWQQEHQANMQHWDALIRDEELSVLPLLPPDMEERLIRQAQRPEVQRSRMATRTP